MFVVSTFLFCCKVLKSSKGEVRVWECISLPQHTQTGYTGDKLKCWTYTFKVMVKKKSVKMIRKNKTIKWGGFSPLMVNMVLDIL